MCLIAIAASGQSPRAWVEKSNKNAHLLIDINAKYGPEGATSDGVKGLDDQITSLAADRRIQMQADLRKAKSELESRLAKEKDPLVRQDLQILIASADRDIRWSEARNDTFIQYYDVPRLVYYGVEPAG